MWEKLKGLRIKAECTKCNDGECSVNDYGDLECPSCLRTWSIE